MGHPPGRAAGGWQLAPRVSSKGTRPRAGGAPGTPGRRQTQPCHLALQTCLRGSEKRWGSTRGRARALAQRRLRAWFHFGQQPQVLTVPSPSSDSTVLWGARLDHHRGRRGSAPPHGAPPRASRSFHPFAKAPFESRVPPTGDEVRPLPWAPPARLWPEQVPPGTGAAGLVCPSPRRAASDVPPGQAHRGTPPASDLHQAAMGLVMGN